MTILIAVTVETDLTVVTTVTIETVDGCEN